jgi:tRNA (guanine-N7-)-methyltransferase
MRKRQHVNVNALCFETFSGELPKLTPGRPVELEVGCADAQFLFERATQDPSRTYIGLEIREALVHDVNKRAAREGLPIQAVWVHASLHLSKILPKHSVRHCYLNFPDPWFKRKHQDRRMINDQLLRQLHPVMEPDGDVLMQSDVFDVALDAMSVFEQCDEL